MDSMLPSANQACIDEHKNSLDLLRALRAVEPETIYFLIEVIRSHDFEKEGLQDGLTNSNDIEVLRTKLIQVAREKVKQYSKYLANDIPKR